MLAAVAEVAAAEGGAVVHEPAAVQRWLVPHLRPGGLHRSAEVAQRGRVPVRLVPRLVPSEQGDPGQVPAPQDFVRKDREWAPLRAPAPMPDN